MGRRDCAAFSRWHIGVRWVARSCPHAECQMVRTDVCVGFRISQSAQLAVIVLTPRLLFANYNIGIMHERFSTASAKCIARSKRLLAHGRASSSRSMFFSSSHKLSSWHRSLEELLFRRVLLRRWVAKDRTAAIVLCSGAIRLGAVGQFDTASSSFESSLMPAVLRAGCRHLRSICNSREAPRNGGGAEFSAFDLFSMHPCRSRAVADSVVVSGRGPVGSPNDAEPGRAESCGTHIQRRFDDGLLRGFEVDLFLRNGSAVRFSALWPSSSNGDFRWLCRYRNMECDAGPDFRETNQRSNPTTSRCYDELSRRRVAMPPDKFSRSKLAEHGGAIAAPMTIGSFDLNTPFSYWVAWGVRPRRMHSDFRRCPIS